MIAARAALHSLAETHLFLAWNVQSVGLGGVNSRFAPRGGWRLGGVGTFGVVACVQEVTVAPGELLADADLIHYTIGASEKEEEEAIRKAVDFSTTGRRQTVTGS
jgi:hypothetical protein